MMFHLALQVNTNDPMFWIMVIIAISFFVIAIAMVAMMIFVGRAVSTVNRLEHRMEPLIDRLTVLS